MKTINVKPSYSLNGDKPATINKRHFSVVSYFAGCGGMDLGFMGGFDFLGKRYSPLPFTISAAYDFDDKCVETYRRNFDHPISQTDLGSTDPAEVPPADLLIGGFPCQDFAHGGPRRGLASSRGQLYRAMIDYLAQHQPKIMAAENVPGLATIDSGRTLKQIISEIEATGYKTEVWTLYAPDFGLPQRRTRIFIIAVREDLPDFPSLPERRFSEDTYRGAEVALKDLESIIDETVKNQSQYFRAKPAKAGNGQGDEVTPRNEPAYTIRANAKSRVQFHYSLNRRLTVRECARLQSFPDDFIFPHSATSNIMQIGNAVPPVLAHAVAETLSNYILAVQRSAHFDAIY